MILTIQFKDSRMNFRGRTYDYQLCPDEKERPVSGDIVRMLNENYDYICHGTRVKVVNVKEGSNDKLEKIRIIKDNL